jgi:hypothetical protein
MVIFGAAAHQNDAQMGRGLKMPQTRELFENCGMKATEFMQL